MCDPFEGPSDPNAGIFGLDLQPEQARVVLLPVPFDATSSYARGSANGPDAIRVASHQVDLFDLEGLEPHRQGVVLLPEAPCVRAWNGEARQLADSARALPPASPERLDTVIHLDALGDKLATWVHEQVQVQLETSRVVGVLGGEHTVAFGAIRAHVEKWPDLGILQLDAHADLRQAYEGYAWSHASVMYNVMTRLPVRKLVQVAVRDLCASEHAMAQQSRDRIVAFYDPQLARSRLEGQPFAEAVARILKELPHQVYVSLDIDALDPSLCPHTGTPVPGGLDFHQVCALLAALPASGRRVVGFDLTEVAPGPPPNQWDGNVAARLLYRLCGLCLQ